MSKPASRQELVDYCLRRLGAPVLEINLADDQIDDLVDDALQYFQERHFDGVERMYLKYQFTQDDINRGTASKGSGVGLVTTTGTQTLTNKTLTTPVISTISNSGTITLPTSSDTLVGRATTDTLTNKTLTSPSIATPTWTATESAIANGDYLLFLDASASSETKKDALADIATLFAGTGLTASNSVIGIDASQTQITGVGTITTGTWQASLVGIDYGGTGLSGETDGYIVIADGSGSATHLDVGSSTGITILGTIATGVWQGTAIDTAYIDPTLTSQTSILNSSLVVGRDADNQIKFSSNELILRIANKIESLNTALHIIDRKIKELNSIILEDQGNLKLLESNPDLFLQRASQSPTLDQVIHSYQVLDLEHEKIRLSQEKVILETRLKFLAQETRTIVFYESPHRLIKTLKQLLEFFEEERRASVSRELSKMHEETVRGTFSELIQYYETHTLKGEIVLVVEGLAVK